MPSFAELTDWFSEDVESFAENLGGKWSYKPGSAVAGAGKIELVEGELVYTPATAAGGDYVVGEHQITFGSAAMSCDDVVTDAVGIQLVEIDSATVLAVVTPTSSGYAWSPTTVAAEIGTEYVIRIEQDYTSGGRVVRYFIKPAASSDFTPVATVELSSSVRLPTKVVHEGQGTLTTVKAQYADADPDPYNRWEACGGLLTWAGYGGSSTQPDAKSQNAVYREWEKVGSAWQDGVAWTGETAFVKHPQMALRFIAGSSDVPLKIGCAFTEFDLAGMMVEKGASGYQLRQLNTPAGMLTRLGDQTGGISWFVINENFSIYRMTGAATFYGDVNLDIASGKYLQINPTSVTYPTKLDPQTHTRLRFHGLGYLRVKTLDASGAVVLDYSDVASGADCLKGALIVDDMTSFVLPATVQPGETFKLCNGNVTGAGSVMRSITVGDRTYSALVTIANVSSGGAELKYEVQDYARFASNPGVFTWCGGSSQLANGVFRRFDCATGTDADETYFGSQSYLNVPGWENVPVTCFWGVFADAYVTNSALPFAQGSGYVLRFAGNHGSGSLLALPQSVMSMGSLLVENGAHDYGLSGDGATSVRLGADSPSVTNRIEVNEDFQFQSAALALLGRVELSVAAGKTLSVRGAEVGAVANAANRTVLRLTGDGTLAVDRLKVEGASTLDFSQLALSRSAPYVSGELVISPLARLRFPAALSEGTAYRLCSGTLTATDGVYAIAKGDGEYFLASLTFDAAQQKVTYSTLSGVSKSTLDSAAVKWSEIRSGITAGGPVQFTLTKSVQLTIDESGVTVPQLLVLGDYPLSIVYQCTPALGSVWVGGNATVEVVYGPDATDFGRALAVPGAVAYETVISGSSSASSPKTWTGALDVGGRLTVRGHLDLASEANGTEQVTIDSGAVITVDSGATLQYAPATSLSGVTFDLAGDWSIGDGVWSPGVGFAVNLRSGGRFSGSSSATVQIAVPVRLAVEGKAALGVTVQAEEPVACSIAASAELVLEGAVEGEGTGLATYGLGVVRNVGMSVAFAEQCFAVGGLVGSGEAVFFGDPSATGVTNSLSRSDRWTGVCSFRGAELGDFNPDQFGNANSSVRLLGCSGYFAQNLSASVTTLEMAAATDEYDYAMDVDNGYDGNLVTLSKLKGEGKLCLRANGSERYRVFLPTIRNFTGSLEVVGVNNRSAIVVGATDSLEKAAIMDNADYDGTILVYSGEVAMASESVWGAVSGIYLRGGATLVDGGKLTSAVIGEGTLKYSSDLRSWQPESAAMLTDGDNWLGTVYFDSLTLYGANLGQCGNANSRIALQGVDGWLLPSTVISEVELLNGGFSVTQAKEGCEVVLNRLTGSGALAFAGDITASGWSYRLLSANDYDGTMTLASELGSVLIGRVSRSQNGAIEVEDGYLLKSKRDWTAPQAKFGATLTVEGEVGDTLMQVLGGNVDFEEIALTLVNGDPRRKYQLSYDADSRSIVIVAASTPPTAKVEEVMVSYGVDMTNAFVSVDISDFWSGYDFDGRTLAEVYVYDVAGKVVGYCSAEITANGTNDIGVVDLPYGRGRDYRYEVRISTDGSSSAGEFIDGLAVEESGVRRESRWIDEDYASYLAVSRSRKTGVWTLPAGAQIDTAEQTIDIKTSGDAGECIVFKPYRETTNEVVEVEHRVRFRGAFDEGMVPTCGKPVNRSAALTLVQLPGVNEELAYGGWVADDSLAEGGYFETLYGREAPALGEELRLGWTINYHTGYIVYSANGTVLTNAAGVSHFALSSARRLRGNRLKYRGTAQLDGVVGSEWNGNLARVASADKTVTNQYETVDQAVAAAIEAGITNITLLWDATWRPSADDLGRTFVFDSPAESAEKFELTLDDQAIGQLRSQGYQVISHGGGSYTIDVINYHISFDPNGGMGEMADQDYSVTNLVFNLASNEFVYATKDFAGWNVRPDGSGPTNWTDRAQIDMSEFGLTNLTLYAQWQVAVRTIVIEPADQYVYVEQVLTNGVRHAGVRYFGTEVATGRGRAEFPLTHGSDLVVYYSTDLEKSLTFDYLVYRFNWTGKVIDYDSEPKVDAAIVSPIALWAANHGISMDSLTGSPYSQASFRLKLGSLLESTSEVRISEFEVTETGYAFKVMVDGVPISSAADIQPMIRVAAQLDGEWMVPAAEAVSVAADGTVSVRTQDGGSFVKIVIPQN